MSTSFKDFTDRLAVNLKFSPGLILGWLTQDNTTQTETRYALYADGRMFRSEPVALFSPESDSFATKGRGWVQVQDIPGNATFIGNYEPPVR